MSEPNAPSTVSRSALWRVTKEAAASFVHDMMRNKVRLLATDESRACGGLIEFNPQTVNHSGRQYVVVAVHTNTIKGLWSIFDRGIVDSFHKVSAKYLPLYVAEFQFRYNTRQNADIFGGEIKGC